MTGGEAGDLGREVPRQSLQSRKNLLTDAGSCIYEVMSIPRLMVCSK